MLPGYYFAGEMAPASLTSKLVSASPIGLASWVQSVPASMAGLFRKRRCACVAERHSSSGESFGLMGDVGAYLVSLLPVTEAAVTAIADEIGRRAWIEGKAVDALLKSSTIGSRVSRELPNSNRVIRRIIVSPSLKRPPPEPALLSPLSA